MTANSNVVCCLLQVEGLEATELAPKEEEINRVSAKENDGSSSLKKQELATEAKDGRRESGLKRTKEEGKSQYPERPRKILKEFKASPFFAVAAKHDLQAVFERPRYRILLIAS